jgi:hypothetical protein
MDDVLMNELILTSIASGLIGITLGCFLIIIAYIIAAIPDWISVLFRRA